MTFPAQRFHYFYYYLLDNVPTIQRAFYESAAVNVVIGEPNENPSGDLTAVTSDVFCVGCMNKVGWESEWPEYSDEAGGTTCQPNVGMVKSTMNKMTNYQVVHEDEGMQELVQQKDESITGATHYRVPRPADISCLQV